VSIRGLAEIPPHMLRLLLALSLVVAVPLCAQDDSALRREIVGTWKAERSSTSTTDAISTFRADGTHEEVIWPIGKIREDGVTIKGEWKIEERILTLRSTASSNPKMIPTGLTLKDRIIELSDSKLVLESLDGYPGKEPMRSTLVRVRAP
jgi:hypothetical protein